MNEKDLTQKQRKWLETSKKIGPGPLTPSERKTLEKLYADMLPSEQQDLFEHIKEKFGKDDRNATNIKEDPISRMENMIWSEPSQGLKKVFGKVQISKPPTPK